MNPTLVSWGPNTTGKRFDLRLVGSSSPNQLRLEITGAALNGTANVADGNWHHVAVTLPAGGTLGSMQLYVDGTLDAATVATGSSSAAVSTTATNVLIGYDLTANSRYFNGLIDDVRIYATNLAAADIQAIALAPGITNLSASLQITAGSNAVLNAGVGELVASNLLSYQWFDSNTNVIANGTNATLILPNAMAAASGYYTVVVTNFYGSVTNGVALTIEGTSGQITLLGPNPLVITQNTPFTDPGAVATNVLGNATGVTTNSTVDINTPGNYTITYTADDGEGNILGVSRTVVVQSLLPVIITGLTNQTVECGGNPVFSVSASGVPLLSYEWNVNGAPIVNATNHTFTLTDATAADGNNVAISVVVSNVNGSVTNSATLTIQDTTPPVINILGANPLILATGSVFTDPGATALDACAGAVPVTTAFAVNTNAPGSYTVTYTATDNNGNTATTNRTVYVKNSAVGSKPNIIFILADDLGYGDVGVFYQNSRANNLPKMITPQLDKLAAQGMIFKQHYSSSPVCAPARASLLLGQNQGNCAIRDNQFDKALPDNHTLATVLKQSGYYCGAIGKWGLAGQSSFPPVYDPSTVTGYPLQHGFDEFFGFVDHAAGHVYYHDSAHPLYQDYTNVTASYENIYSTDLFFARAKKFISDREAANPSQPFFLYLAPTAVHAALQVPGGPFPAGSGINGGLQWPLSPTPATADTWIHPDYTNATTTYANSLVQPGNWTDTMKRYATIDRRLDDGVGDLLQLLNDLKIATNTLIIFSSDNGPANESDGGAYTSDPRYFDSWANMDGIKRDLWEAGVREPTIAWWPGTINSNSVSDVISAFWDWVPTFAEVAGQVPPAESDGVSLLPALTGLGTQRSRGYWYFEYYYDGTFPVDGGTSGLFARKGVSARNQLQSIRIGDYVAVRYSITSGTDPFRLYNVVADPHEDNDLSGNPTNAAFLAQVQTIVKQVRQPNSSAARPYDSDLVPAAAFSAGTNPVSPVTPETALAPFATINGITNGALDYAVYQGSWPWVPDLDALSAITNGKVAGLDTSLAASTNNFGISYRGYILVPSDGQYTFYLTDDSGAELWLHEVHVIDDDYLHTGAEVSSTILLKAGLHPLRLFYRHAAGNTNLSLKYSGPGITKQTVPLAAFFSDCTACAGTFDALEESVSIAENASTNINILANVLTQGSGTLSLVSVSQPQAGTSVINSGNVLYTPNTNFLGDDSFTYTVTDGHSLLH
jgi:arylsulfatase A-like enzyme